MNIIAILATAAALSLPTLAAEQDRYAGFEVKSGEDPGLVFRFSASQATAEDPVVITAAARDLTNEDRQYRVDLQKVWLQRNVPTSYQVQGRDLVTCPIRGNDEFGACDRYEFKDANGVTHEFYFYLVQWP